MMVGTIYHRVVVATIPLALLGRLATRKRWPGYDIPARVAAFREELPAEYRGLLVGPVPYGVNGGVTWFFSTDGSKGGDCGGNEVFQWQERFVEVFDRPECWEEGSHLCTVLVVQWPDSGGLDATTVRRV